MRNQKVFIRKRLLVFNIRNNLQIPSVVEGTVTGRIAHLLAGAAVPAARLFHATAAVTVVTAAQNCLYGTVHLSSKESRLQVWNLSWC